MRPPPGPVTIAATLAGATLATWIATVERMRGMEAGPGANPGALGWFVGVWVTMTAAMMLPPVAPMALLFARVSRERRSAGPNWSSFEPGCDGIAPGLASKDWPRAARSPELPPGSSDGRRPFGNRP